MHRPGGFTVGAGEDPQWIPGQFADQVGMSPGEGGQFRFKHQRQTPGIHWANHPAVEPVAGWQQFVSVPMRVGGQLRSQLHQYAHGPAANSGRPAGAHQQIVEDPVA